jgi:hypothetical protein
MLKDASLFSVKDSGRLEDILALCSREDPEGLLSVGTAAGKVSGDIIPLISRTLSKLDTIDLPNNIWSDAPEAAGDYPHNDGPALA